MPSVVRRLPLVSMLMPVLLLCGTTSLATAQVRMSLRNTMQIDGLGTGPSADERFWPVEVNGFAVGDVDGDGDLDLLGAGAPFESRVWFNDGDGAFVRFATLPSGGSRCALFDADGDGDLDALTAGGRTTYAHSTPSGLALNNGAGAFTPSPDNGSPPLSDQIETSGLAVGDIDNDGDQDVVITLVSAHPASVVRLWRNTGNATFVDDSVAVQPAVTGSYRTCALVDVEPDGDLDLVFPNAPTTCEVRLNDGTGHFSLGPTVPHEVLAVNGAAADFDGDGLLDRAGVVNDPAGFGSVADVPYLRRNIGNGQFQDVSSTWFEPHALVDRTAGYAFHACIAFDADGDGDPDLVTGGSEGRSTTSTTVGVPPKLFLNIDGQRFVDGSRPAFPFLQQTGTAADAGDIDGDGDVDLVLSANAAYVNAPADIWKQDGAGCFVESGSMGLSCSALKLADVDSDGDLDLITIAGWGQVFLGVTGQHGLSLNNGQGNFTDVTATHMPITAASGGASCAVGDVDGDGDPDLVIGSYSPGWSGPGVPLMLLLNNGSGVFSDASGQMPTTLFDSGFVELRNFDGDNDLDLVVAADPYHTTSRSLLFFENNGAGVFTDVSAARLPMTPGATGLSVLDLDNDGDLDVAQSNVDLVNDGTGHFTATAVAGSRVLVADLDEDGAPDAVRETCGLGGCYELKVGTRSIFACEVYDRHIVLPVDLDQDDDLDLVCIPLRGFSQMDWRRPQAGVVYNLRRDVRVVTQPRLGHPYRMQLRATNGAQSTTALVCFATASLTPRIEILSFGALLLDPAALIPWAAVVIPDSDTAVEVTAPIPNQPEFHGLPLSCQSLLIPTGDEQRSHLTNGMTHTIER